MESKLNMKKMSNMKKFGNNGILLSIIILFSISIILIPSSVYAQEINVKSMGVEKTSIITFTNDGTTDIKTFRIWLSQDAKFESFKTEKGWIGEKTPQGVIVFSSSESIKEDQSVKFGIKTDKPNPVINWKGLDITDSVIDTGVISTKKIQKVNENPSIDSNQNIIDTDGEIFSNSEFRIIPDKPNAGSTIRVVGENFGTSQLFDFYIENNRIGNFESDNNGNFITTMKVPNNISGDRVEFKVKNNQGEEKVVSLRLGENQNRIEKSESKKISIDGIEQITFRGDKVNLFGTATPSSTVIIELKDPSRNTINTRTAQVDSLGNWKLDKEIDIPFDAVFGKYSVIVSDGRNQNLKYTMVENNKIIQINPTQIMFDPGSIIKFNGTAVPNEFIELLLEDNFGNEVSSEIIKVNESGYVEFTYQTTENDDEEGTWTLIATQKDQKEFSFTGYGEMPIIPINLEFNKGNYKSTENAIISLLGKPSEILKMIILNPAGKIINEEIEIKLQEDGRATYELELNGYSSGIYTALVKKGNSQSDEKFSVGLVTGSGPINAQVTSSEYLPGEKILLLGQTSSNVLLNVKLIDPNGVEIKRTEIASNSDGSFKVDDLKIPSNAIPGKWKITVSSGASLDSSEFEVIMTTEDLILIEIGEMIDIQGYGEALKIGVTAGQKTSITMIILDNKGIEVSEEYYCVPTSEFKCEFLWSIPKDLLPGTYIIRVTDSIIVEEKFVEIK